MPSVSPNQKNWQAPGLCEADVMCHLFFVSKGVLSLEKGILFSLGLICSQVGYGHEVNSLPRGFRPRPGIGCNMLAYFYIAFYTALM